MCCQPALQEEVLSSSTFNLAVTETTDFVSKGLSQAQSRLDNVGQWLPNWFFMLLLVVQGMCSSPAQRRLHKTQTKVVVPLLEGSLLIYLHPVRVWKGSPLRAQTQPAETSGKASAEVCSFPAQQPWHNYCQENLRHISLVWYVQRPAWSLCFLQGTQIPLFHPLLC